MNAVHERNLPRHGTRADIGWHVSQRHGQRVAPAVFSFGVPLPDKIVRDVTIAAGGHVRVLPLAPVIEGFAHYVTIRARVGVIAEVGGALCVVECVERRAKWHREEADRHRQVDRTSTHNLGDCSCNWRRRKRRKRLLGLSSRRDSNARPPALEDLTHWYPIEIQFFHPHPITPYHAM